MSYSFSRLPESRVEEAFAVLQRVAKSIEAKGRRQRISKTSLDTYRSWQAEQANYIVTKGDEIIGLITIRRELLVDWPEFVKLGPVWMVRALATHPDHRGKGVGAVAMREAINLCGGKESIYLDCVSEFLPSYYEQLGFTSIARQDQTCTDGKTYDISLMRYKSE